MIKNTLLDFCLSTYVEEATSRLNGDDKVLSLLQRAKVTAFFGTPAARVRVRVKNGGLLKEQKARIHVQENASVGDDVDGEPDRNKNMVLVDKKQNSSQQQHNLIKQHLLHGKGFDTSADGDLVVGDRSRRWRRWNVHARIVRRLNRVVRRRRLMVWRITVRRRSIGRRQTSRVVGVLARVHGDL